MKKYPDMTRLFAAMEARKQTKREPIVIDRKLIGKREMAAEVKQS
jgi:hypothetical protein